MPEWDYYQGLQIGSGAIIIIFFFLYDWLRKRRIYNDNNAVNLFKLNEINKELIHDTYEYKVMEDFNYYEKLRTKLFSTIKHSQEYKAVRFYEIQALMQRFGKPDLFVTVCFNVRDEEVISFVKGVLRVNITEWINFNNFPVEFALYYKKKVAFVRSLFKPDSKTPSIFGKVNAYADTLEYSKAGVPHLHFLIWLDEESKHNASIEGNNLVFARLKNPRGIRDDELNMLIRENQIRRWLKWKCNVRKNGTPSIKWLNGYPFEPSEKDYSQYDNSTVYYARTNDDINIVPYNPEFLKLMRCPTNVQIVNSENIAVYMSKYITVTRKDYIKKKNNEKLKEMIIENPVEQLLKSKLISIIEAAMEILQSQSYWIYPKLYNLRLRLPNERLLKLLPFNQIRKLLDEINQSQKTSDWSDCDSEDDDNILGGILAPSIWENYMARNSKLENITFIEMLSKYKWCSNEKIIPQRWFTTNEPGYYLQWSFNELRKYRDDEDLKNNWFEESD